MPRDLFGKRSDLSASIYMSLFPAVSRVQRRLLENSLISFLYNKCTDHLVIPSEPLFDEAGLRFFTEVISRTSIYVEYGSGGSTLLASKYAKLIVSVDSDHRFLERVKKELDKSSTISKLELVRVDVGLTGMWGYPVFTRPTVGRRRRWKRYAIAPWEVLRREAIEPDTILVDGRFRVACTLESFLNLGKTSSCTILVDDYAERPYYKPIEHFGDLMEVHGRMAVFRRKPTIEEAECRQALEHFYSDFR
jgi:hypothetical protein